MRPALKFLLLTLLIVTRICPATLIDFNQFRDGDAITNQIPGVTFTNAAVLTAGISLNEFEFPPHSDPNVASDSGGPLSIAFATPVFSFSAYFTYSVPITLQEFDSDNHLIASAASHFGSNLALSGDPGSSPNELLQIDFLVPTPISRVVVTGATDGGSFAMDDISFQASTIPEPGYSMLLLAGAIALFSIRPRKRA